MITYVHVTTVSGKRGYTFEREQGLVYGEVTSVLERREGRIK